MKNKIMLWGSAVLMYCSSCKSNHEATEEAVSYLVTAPLQLDTVLMQHYVCQINAIRHIELRSQERGYLQKIYVDEGQYVHKGQLLFQIMPNLYNVEYQKAQAEVEAAHIELENTTLLSNKNVVAPNELALAKAKLSKANAEMALSKTHLDFTRITAPYDGYIDRFDLKLGSLVAEGDLLTTLSDNTQMWVYFNVPESEYLNYKANTSSRNLDSVQLLMANNELFKFNGTVSAIEADFNNETGNIAFRATFPNPDHLLRNGQTGNIIMKIPVKNAIIIPQKATVEILDKKYVYVVGEDKKVKLRPITISAEMADLFVVGEGLTAQDKILLEGLNKVKDNQKISFKYEEPRKVMAALKLDSE
jgi:membrane fusion protein (multidrug efflux system)